MQVQSWQREERTGNSYREFSRRRYLELRATFGERIRESEIIQRIIREWDDLKAAKKDRAPASPPPTATPLKLELPQEKPNLLNSTSARKDDPQAEHHQEVTVRPFSAGSPLRRPIAKPHNSYVSFYRHQFESVSRTHPNWTAAKVTTIVKLLWLREKRQSKQAKGRLGAGQEGRLSKLKKRSGRMVFKQFKLKQGMSAAEASRRWRRLPKDSRRHYERAGDPQANATPSGSLTSIVKTSVNATPRMGLDLTEIMSKK